LFIVIKILHAPVPPKLSLAKVVASEFQVVFDRNLGWLNAKVKISFFVNKSTILLTNRKRVNITNNLEFFLITFNNKNIYSFNQSIIELSCCQIENKKCIYLTKRIHYVFNFVDRKWLNNKFIRMIIYFLEQNGIL